MKALHLTTGVLTMLMSISAMAEHDLTRRDPYVVSTPPAPLFGTHTPARTCESLTTLQLEHTTITEASVSEATDEAPVLCNVTAVIKRSEKDDPVTVWVRMPVHTWNGRFMGIGGGGYAGGITYNARLHHPAGFATGVTDAGPLTSARDRTVKNGAFAIGKDGKRDMVAIENFAHRGVHIMSVTGKAITTAYYGKAPGYSYFNGCSTGGRQAMMEAQRYPQDYNGILVGAPGINWANYVAGRVWGQMHMELTDTFVPACKLQAVSAAAVSACDQLDGVTDGLLGNPRLCTYDPANFVGTEIADCGTFTEADANIARKAWTGPRTRDGSISWYGFTHGTPLEKLQATEKNPETGALQTHKAWNAYFLSWHRYFLAQDPTLQIGNMTIEAFENYWRQSIAEYTELFSADNPDLSILNESGGKVLMWHGELDEYIPPSGAIDYLERVQKTMREKADDTFKLYMAPGVEHCSGGPGPRPTALLDALIDWVENGQEPATLLSVNRDTETGAITRSRPLCPYPQVARYKGTGSVDEAQNFECADSY